MSDTNTQLTSTDAVEEEVLEVELDDDAEAALDRLAASSEKLKHPTIAGRLEYNAKTKEFALVWPAFGEEGFWKRLHPSAVKTIPATYDKEGRLLSNEKVTGGKVNVVSITVPSVIVGDRARAGGILNMTMKTLPKTARATR